MSKTKYAARCVCHSSRLAEKCLDNCMRTLLVDGSLYKSLLVRASGMFFAVPWMGF